FRLRACAPRDLVRRRGLRELRARLERRRTRRARAPGRHAGGSIQLPLRGALRARPRRRRGYRARLDAGRLATLALSLPFSPRRSWFRPRSGWAAESFGDLPEV